MQHKLLIATIMGIAGLNFVGKAQDADALRIMVGGSFAKPKIVPRLEKFAVTQITVNYKLTSTQTTVGKEKSYMGGSKMAGAKITAYLETTDGELTEADFQEVTDHFYAYFQKKLKSSGIDTVAWSKITATEFYKDNAEKSEGNDEKEENQVKMTTNARNGARIYGGGTAFAFGKAKKATNFCEEVNAPAGFFHLTVDFADLSADVDIKTKRTTRKETTTTKYSSSVKPNMKVVPTANTGLTLLWNEKSQSETVIVQKDISSGYNYQATLTEDASRIKNRAFAFAKSMKPVVIETTREQYKAAAKKALEKYADTFIALAKKN